MTAAHADGPRCPRRLFRDHTGLPAQTVSRILRFHRTLAVASSGCRSLAEPAVRGGYHDRAPKPGGEGHIQPFNDFGLRHARALHGSGGGR